MMEILRAMARRSGLKWQVNVRMLDNEPQFFLDAGPRNMRLNQIFFKPEVIVGLAGILTFFSFQVSGKKCKLLFAKGAEQLIKQMSTTGFKTALKGGAMVVGGAVGLAFALPEAIDNWKDLIKKTHVTEASQSLRDTANAILKISRTLREQFNDMKKMFDEMTKIQQEHEEKSDGEDEESDQEDVESDGEDEESDQEDEESDGEDEESDQEDVESDGEDEESDQEDEESDSEEETEDDESKQIGKKRTKRHQKKGTESKQRGETKEVTNQCQDSCIGQDQKRDRSINEESNHKFETYQRPPAIRVGLSNVRTMNNKTSRISELITQKNLDVFLTTETWLREDTGDSVLRRASPQNFDFNHQVRGSRGGGVAIQFSQKLQGEHILFDFVTTFECVATVLQHDEWDEPVLIINVYHPPGYNLTQFRAFLDEFQMLLDDVSEVYNSIIVTGDFNIWVDNERRTSTDEFAFLLPIYGLVQHVEEPTHQAGHFLDLVITRNVEIYSLFVRDDDISDHYTVYFNARPVSTDTKEETEENMEQDEQAKRFKKKNRKCVNTIYKQQI